MSDPQRLRNDPALRAVLASADDDGPTPSQLTTLAARVRARRARSSIPLVLAALTLAAAIVVVLLLPGRSEEPARIASSTPPTPPSDARPLPDAGAPTDAPDAPVDAGVRKTSFITIETDPDAQVFVEDRFKGRGTQVVEGRPGQYFIASCHKSIRTRKGTVTYKRSDVHLKFTGADHKVTCRPVPPPRPGYTWVYPRGWVPIGTSEFDPY